MVNRGPVKAPGAGENAHRRRRLNRRRFTGHRLANSKSEIRVRVYSTLSVKNTEGRPRVATDTEHGTQANSVHTCCDEDKTSCLLPAQVPALSHLQRHARTGGVAQGVGWLCREWGGRGEGARERQHSSFLGFPGAALTLSECCLVALPAECAVK